MAEHIVDNFLEESRFVPLSAQRRAQLEKFCKRLGIHMDRLELLDRGLTHTSFAHETPKVPHNSHNERLEFLGDSVLSLVVSSWQPLSTACQYVDWKPLDTISKE